MYAVRYSLVPTSSCVVLQFQEYFKSTSKLPKTSRIPCTFTRELGVAGWGYQWGRKGPKLRSVGESTLQKPAHESGKVAYIYSEILQKSGKQWQRV